MIKEHVSFRQYFSFSYCIIEISLLIKIIMSYRYAQFKDLEPFQPGPTETYANMAADATDRDVTYAFEHVQVPK